LTDGKKITNFPINALNYYTFNGEKVSTRSSITIGAFLNQNDINKLKSQGALNIFFQYWIKIFHFIFKLFH
jgi:hypothetical protein